MYFLQLKPESISISFQLFIEEITCLPVTTGKVVISNFGLASSEDSH